MLKRNFKYLDYNGVERDEDLYFNLNEAEVVELNMQYPGGLENLIRKVISAQDGKTIMTVFKDIILRSYGEKSDDGKRFVKSKELSEAFSQTEAYNQLFMELIFDAEKAAAFVNAITPKEKSVNIPAMQRKVADAEQRVTNLVMQSVQDDNA